MRSSTTNAWAVTAFWLLAVGCAKPDDKAGVVDKADEPAWMTAARDAWTRDTCGFENIPGVTPAGRQALSADKIEAASTARIFQGHFIVRNTFCLARLRDFDGVVGDVDVELESVLSSGMHSLEMTLGFVTGELRISGGDSATFVRLPNLEEARLIAVSGANVKAIEMPALQTVDDIALVNLPQLTQLDLSALRRLGRLTVRNTGLVEMLFPRLNDQPEDMQFSANLALETVSFSCVLLSGRTNMFCRRAKPPGQSVQEKMSRQVPDTCRCVL